MSVREILEIGHPVLAAVAAPVPAESIQSNEVQRWIDDLIDTMRDANGAGLAANQVGIPHRIFVIEVKDNPRYPYKPNIPLTIAINPKIEFLSERTFTSNEGCLSVPSLRGEVERHVEIKVSYLDREGQPVTQTINGYSACTWQHEYDHLDGLLFPHRVTDPNTFCSWKIFKQYHQQHFAERVAQLVAHWGA